jgi:hypothetical protein
VGVDRFQTTGTSAVEELAMLREREIEAWTKRGEIGG